MQSTEQELYRLYRPKGNEIPVLINVPHAGEYMPAKILQQLQVPLDKCKRDLDLYVDEIWANAPEFGATLLAANYNRYVVDLNRAEDDISPETVIGGVKKNKPGYYGSRGVVWLTTTEGHRAWPSPFTQEAYLARINAYHRPYHQALEQELTRIKETFGYVIMIDGHSMPSRGRSKHPDSGSKRADVVPGDADGTTCDPKISDLIKTHFLSEGYTVAPNDPYKGAYDTRHYGQPKANQHAIQIELSRACYMNEQSFERFDSKLQELGQACCALLPKLAKLNLKK